MKDYDFLYAECYKKEKTKSEKEIEEIQKRNIEYLKKILKNQSSSQ